jgi:DNA-binding NarL/FixJ family response regulator
LQRIVALLHRSTTSERTLKAARALVTELHESVLAMQARRKELQQQAVEVKTRRESLSQTSESLRAKLGSRHRIPTPPPSPSSPALSERQRSVLQGVLAGEANKAIAYELGISVKTVETHRARIMQKFHAESLAELLRCCLTAGSRS